MKKINLTEAFWLTIATPVSKFEKVQALIRKLGFRECDGVRQLEKGGLNVIEIDILVNNVAEAHLLGMAVERVN